MPAMRLCGGEYLFRLVCSDGRSDNKKTDFRFTSNGTSTRKFRWLRLDHHCRSILSPEKTHPSRPSRSLIFTAI